MALLPFDNRPASDPTRRSPAEPDTSRGNINALGQSILLRNIREAIRQLRWRLWDWWHHVETCEIVEISSLQVVGNNRAHAIAYEASGSARAILKALPIRYQDYGFIDFGSGKGRVLLVASGFPFRSVDGVECSVHLHAIAEKNIREYRRAKTRCGQVRSVLADATAFPLPTVPLVLYFYHPFAEPVLIPVIDNIRRSLLANPRELIIVCAGKWMPKEPLSRIPNIQVLWQRKYSTVFRVPCNPQDPLSEVAPQLNLLREELRSSLQRSEVM